MSDTHHTPAAVAPATAGADTQWRQGGVIGAAVGLALAVVLSVGLTPTRFPDGGGSLWLARAIGVACGVIAGACLGMAIGAVTPTDPATRQG